MTNALNALGLSLTARSFTVVCENHLVQWELVKAGLGVGVMSADVGDAEPRVRRALASLAPVPIPMWLTSHRELRTSRRVRVVYDMLAAALAPPDEPADR